ncbi:MAG: hypothetical protein FWF49_03165, partial [Oscillospiraceae bacterium]|nr:hypothetical protein [Oscillospiraceae bacterium]
FDIINVDLIAGLSSDTFDGFCASLEGVCALAPASVTVHTLALKRAARLAQEDDGQGNDAETEMYRGTPDGECPTKGGLTDETASAFNKVAPSAAFASDEAVRAMVAHSVQTLRSGGWQPYYLYRQSRSRGNQENTGWARPGRACAYNIYMMDETHTILACGAGAVTKLRDPYSPRIERVFNFKYPYEYNRGSGDMLERKGRVAQFYRSSS